MINLISGNLPDNRTYQNRTFTLLETDGSVALTITQDQRKARFIESYSVEEDTSERPPMRTFILHKCGTDELYAVSVGPIGKCTCKAGSTGRRCKHLDAIEAAIAEGGLTPTDERAMDLAWGRLADFHEAHEAAPARRTGWRAEAEF